MKTKILFCALIMISSVCLAADEEVQRIQQMLNEQAGAWNRGDLEKFIRAYDDDGRLVFIGSSGVIRSPRELKEKYEKKYGEGKSEFGTLSFSEVQVELLAKNVARAYGRWAVQQKADNPSGWFSLILYKTGKGWRIIHDHSS